MAILMVIAILTVALLVVVSTIVVAFRILKTYRRKARHAGYSSLGDYLRATPRSDEEKRDAVDLAARGLVICILGLVFPPLLLIGVFPLYFGARKVAYSSMGFGLFEDADPPSA